MSKLKVYILNRFAGKSSNYTSWMAACPYDCEVVESYAPDWKVPDDAGVIVTHMHYRWEEVSALRRIHESGRVPVLVLGDGVLEYRNTWENPGIAVGSVFQPVLGHKLACIGRAQARIVESWGNVGKCEIVGMPRLDHFATAEYLPVQTEGPFRILIATANQPAFTPQQRENTVESLRLLRQRFDLNDTVNGRAVELTWRLTDGLASEIGIHEDLDDNEEQIPISDAIELADAVITTPSTLYLESVIKRRPTAILDFNNCPAYVPAAWTISAPLHLNPVIRELENPPAAKMLFQRTTLHDHLELDGRAKERLFQMIETLVSAGIDARGSQSKIELPMRVLSDPQKGFPRIETDFDRLALHPEHKAFQITEVDRLQLELNHAIKRLGQLPDDLDRKDADITAKNADIDRKDAQIERLVAELDELLTKKNADIERKNQHIDSLNELFKTSNERVKLLRQRYLEQAETMLELKTQLKPAKPQLKPAVVPFESPQIKKAA